MKKRISLFDNNRKKKIWLILNIYCTVLYLTWRLFFTIPFGEGPVSIIAGFSLLIIEILGSVEALVHFINMYNVEEHPKPDVDPALLPDVDIFVSTYNESTELLRKTLLGCRRMDYPDKNKVHIYLCDDGHRAEMKALAAEVGVNYLDRETHAGQKAGNLNNALAHSSSPYVVTFDADMIPRSNFLLETIPYFVDAELRNQGRAPEDQIHLGLLQTPQSFYDLDLFQFNLHSELLIPNEQDYFYRDIEVARTRTNSVIYGGSNTILSRAALMDIGGFFTDAITEDFATGLLLEKKGYVSLALSTPLASGLSPTGLQELIQQRVRWARGVIDTGRKMHIYTSKDLTFAQKMNYWASVWYWYAPIKRLCYIMCPLLYAVFGFTVFRCTLPQVLAFWVPMYVTSNITLKSFSNNIRSTKWTAIYEYILFPYMLIPVILETFGFSLKKFKVTKKQRTKGVKELNLVYIIPYVILAVLSVAGLINCVRIMFASGSLGPMVVLFWLIVNLYSMAMCIFFVAGRASYRSAERVYVQLPATLTSNGVSYPCTTCDISEQGICIRIDDPHFVDAENPGSALIEVTDRNYSVTLRCSVVHVSQRQGEWRYAFTIDELVSENGYDQLLAICYDRIPTHPQAISKNSGIYQDLSHNLERRLAPSFYQKRAFPRIQSHKKIMVEDASGTHVEQMVDFNYLCLLLDSGCRQPEITAHFGEVPISFTFVRSIERGSLYQVNDLSAAYSDQTRTDAVMTWVLSDQEPIDKTPAPPKKEKKAEFSEMSYV